MLSLALALLMVSGPPHKDTKIYSWSAGSYPASSTGRVEHILRAAKADYRKATACAACRTDWFQVSCSRSKAKSLLDQIRRDALAHHDQNELREVNTPWPSLHQTGLHRKPGFSY
ncbi:MAG TPA: hypothetical protein VG944_02930 [Fimbriimonas sp.]|nr:hypothetical protein [Fimbriimonas sp.]